MSESSTTAPCSPVCILSPVSLQDMGMEEGWAEAGLRRCIQGHMAADCKSQELHTQPMLIFRPGHDIMIHTCYHIISLFLFLAFSFPRAFGGHQGKQEVFARLRESVSKRTVKVCSNLQL